MFTPDYSDAVKVIDSSKAKCGTVFEILEYKKYRKKTYASYATTTTTSPAAAIENIVTEKMRQVRISLNDSGIIMQPGALQFMKGPINMEIRSISKSAIKGFFKSMGTGESSVTPHYSGKYGEIYLEPSYKYFYLLEMDNEDLVLDDGMFYCCEDTVALSVHVNKNVSAGLFGGEGFKQPKLSGSGLAVLESDVPFEEVLIYHLDNETLKVDGNLALVVRGNIELNIEKSSKSIIGTAKSGEGLLHVYRGTGEVWLAPGNAMPPLNI